MNIVSRGYSQLIQTNRAVMIENLKDRDVGRLSPSFPVQKGLKSIEYIESIEIENHIYGGYYSTSNQHTIKNKSSSPKTM